MPTTNVISNPFPLGLITPGATFAFASVAITANLTDLATSAVYGQVDTIFIRALPGNGGNIYICNSVANPNETTYLNVLDVLPGGASTSFSSSAMNTIQLSWYFIGADNATDAALITIKLR